MPDVKNTHQRRSPTERDSQVTLRETNQVLRTDLARVWCMLEKNNRWGRAQSVLLTPGIHAIAVYRWSQWGHSKTGLGRYPLRLMLLIFEYVIRILWGIELHAATRIGEGFYIGHFGGVIISPKAVIGRNFTCSQDVSIGVSGEGETYGAPTIGNDVYVAPGAKLFGKIRIGHNVKIGANAVIYKDVPDHAVVVLDPGFRIISYNGNVVRNHPCSGEHIV